ncbi:type I toxin-antitoxin system Ibs family toxin [Salmonella enterica subsp. enterica]|uniref:Type I toxin-antitoxin system Ibs family toxin n=3 Tax=Salmonella enterica I TaxID=59201 RepID=A0A624B378_SALMO|nr:type I toxin-antitoxin system Ibs family toxin [Salmonella enterica]EAC2142940.1 type I toxin-antitoxin system Ibs family toxin [Salmonella enterica subsp. enterica]EBZ5929057.1 type I toxin-antitoxin system Ibs family toxin [Salmonella enterica subsp. enterica serovar Weslaco]EBZ6047619.1 type I toxin-antitoxin system Ibs family toxin [Salmonella enterica subsp. enterica serovar Texas]ECS6016851.1 type I toxin-antitoxin system Ibs family toxin [Salmonella enterica subsp. enterica serovar Ro
MRGRSSNAKSAGERPGRPLTNNRDVSKGLKRESPSRGRGFNKERVMMHQVIILIVLLLISFAAY